MEYDYGNADRLGDDAWMGAAFFRFREKRAPAEEGIFCESREEFFQCLRQIYRSHRNVRWSIF